MMVTIYFRNAGPVGRVAEDGRIIIGVRHSDIYRYGQTLSGCEIGSVITAVTSGSSSSSSHYHFADAAAAAFIAHALARDPHSYLGGSGNSLITSKE